MRVGLPHIAGLHRSHMVRMVVGQVLGRGRGALLHPGGHLVIHVFGF